MYRYQSQHQHQHQHQYLLVWVWLMSEAAVLHRKWQVGWAVLVLMLVLVLVQAPPRGVVWASHFWALVVVPVSVRLLVAGRENQHIPV